MDGTVERWNDEFCDFYILKEKIILYLYTLYTLKCIVPSFHRSAMLRGNGDC